MTLDELAEHLMAKRRYARGGYIAAPVTDDVPLPLSRGVAFVTWGTYKKYGLKTLQAMYPNSDIEIAFSAEEVRAAGRRALDALNGSV